MIDKKYYDLLEVEEGANKEKIIKAYDMLLLRARHDETIDIVAINKAYDILTGNVKVELSEKDKEKKAKSIKRAGKLPYYIISGIILAIVLVIAIPAIFKGVPVFNVTFVGNYSLSDKYINLENEIKDIDSVKKVEITSIYLDSTSNSGEMDVAGRVTLASMLQTTDGDIFITNTDGFNYMLTDENSLKPFTKELLEELGITNDDKRLEYNSANTVVYGINLEDDDLITNSVIGEGKKILVISNNTENYDKIIEIIKTLLLY